MRETKFFKAKFSVGCLLFAIALNANAGADEKIIQLEKEIKEIQARLSNLEKSLIGKSHSMPTVGAGDGWKYLQNWRSLKSGMGYGDARAILGEPSKIDGGSVAYWYYKNNGRVIFVRDKIQSWEEPVDLMQ